MAQEAQMPMPKPVVVESLDHLVLNVKDVEVSAAWYQRVLGMKRHITTSNRGAQPGRTFLTFGNQKINLRPITTAKEERFTANHEATGSEDLCFVSDADPKAVVAHLRRCNVAIELGPVETIGARGNMTSVYCRDPDGSLVEICFYRDIT
jgi:catechol 2,3-dioxygenase-like lactoylglutathione lyase family enzyme